MSNFTTEVRYICEEAAGYDESQERDKVSEIISAARTKIFDFDYPIFDPEYKPVLERKILMHYYTREISYETVALWKLHLEARMNEIMPKYNKLYELELLTYNPLWDVDLTEDKVRSVDTDTTGTENRVGTVDTTTNTQNNTTRNGTHSDSGHNYYSDTPQGYVTDLVDGRYLTNATITGDSGTTADTENSTGEVLGSEENSRNTQTTGTVDTTDEYLKHIKGKGGGLTYAKMLEQEIDLIDKVDNIDWRIIRELKDLFFTLWE